MARLWAGIHDRSDHVQGMRLGDAGSRLLIAQLQADGVGAPRGTSGELPDFDTLPPKKPRVPSPGGGGTGGIHHTPRIAGVKAVLT